jgi:hypothetical protein
LWTSASETNTSHFIIERTTNGQEFVEVGRVKAAGNSSSTLNYHVKDLNPEEGNNYYRLTEVDLDGKTYSGELVAARFSKTLRGISVIPNPAEKEIGVDFISDKNSPVTISIMNANGTVVMSKDILCNNDGLNDVPFNISKLMPGIYSVQIVTSGESRFTRFIKQ